MGPDDVLEYARRLRDAGIEEVAFSLQATEQGVVHHVTAVRLSSAPPTAPAAPARPLTDEERKSAEREKRRARYRVELGFTPSDEQLDKLP